MKIQIERTEYGATLTYWRENKRVEIEDLTDNEKSELIVFLELFAKKTRKLL